MDRLASCYFCGVAVEAPLEEYPVVPRDLRPSVEDQSTVVLCPECRRKLSTIVERVVAASSDPAQTELGESAESTADRDEGDRSPVETVERFDDERPNLVDFDRREDRDAGTVSREAVQTPDAEERESEPAEPETNEADAPADEEPTAADEDAGDDQPSRTAETAGSERAGGTGGQPAAAGGRAPEGQATEPGGRTEAPTDDTREDETADRDFSTSAYNNIVRLLQNREFPVDEEEITTVAGSAYGIGRRETDAVIDALVDRGILERDGSQLHRSDD